MVSNKTIHKAFKIHKTKPIRKKKNCIFTIHQNYILDLRLEWLMGGSYLHLGSLVVSGQHTGKEIQHGFPRATVH